MLAVDWIDQSTEKRWWFHELRLIKMISQKCLYICHTSHNVCAYIRTAYLTLTAIVILLTSKVHLKYFNLFISKWMPSWCELLPFLNYCCLKVVLAEHILFDHFKGAYLNLIFIMGWMAELGLFYHFKGAYLNVIIMWMLGGLILFSLLECHHYVNVGWAYSVLPLQRSLLECHHYVMVKVMKSTSSLCAWRP